MLLRGDAPGRERESRPRRLVDPVHVVHEDGQRPVGRRLDENRQRADADGEEVGVALPERERRLERAGLCRREAVDEVEDGMQQLVEAGERDLRLGLDAGHAQATHPGGRRAGGMHERRLADPRVADEEQGAAQPAAGVLEQAGDLRALLLPSDQHSLTVLPSALRRNTRRLRRGTATVRLRDRTRGIPEADQPGSLHALRVHRLIEEIRMSGRRSIATVSSALLATTVGRRAVVVVACGVVAGAFLVAGAAAVPGDLDPGFNSTGKQSLNFGGTDRATHVAVGSGGTIVVVGATDSTGGGDFAVARLRADGTRDTTFGTNGQVAIGTQAGSNDVGGGVVVLPDQSIVFSGLGNTTRDFVVKRLKLDGSADASFGSGGTTVVDFGATDSANAMLRQPDGKLVIVGSTGPAQGPGDAAIVRLNPDGSPDATFSGDGRQTVDFGGDDGANGVALTSDSKIVVAGTGGGGNDIVVARLETDGSLDASFGPGGKVTVDFGGTEKGAAAAVASDDRIVVVGSTSAEDSGDFAVVRLNEDGTRDPSFSGDGKLTAGYAAPNEDALGVVIQQNEKIVVMGQGGANHDFVLLRLLPGGTADASFGATGSIGVDFNGFEYDGDVALQPDGRIVIVGSTNVADGGDIAVARVSGDPASPPTPAPAPTPAPPPAPAPTPAPKPAPAPVTTPRPSGPFVPRPLPRGIGSVFTIPRSTTTIGIDLNGDGRPDYSAPGRLPNIGIFGPSAINRSIGVISGGRRTPVRIDFPGSGLPANRVPLTVIFAAGSSLFDEKPSKDCTQASIIQALIDARGCYTTYTSIDQVPGPERATAQAYYGSTVLPRWLARMQPCRGDEKSKNACETATKLFTKEYRVYGATGTVQLNGLTITPLRGHEIIVDPAAERIFSSFAILKLGVIPIKIGELDLDFTNVTVKVTGRRDASYNGQTKPVATFDARKGLPFVGGFPVAAGGEIAFAAHEGVRESAITLHVVLPPTFKVFGSGQQPSAAGTGLIGNDRPFHVDTLDFLVPQASIGGIGFQNIAFHYAARGDTAANCARDYWHASASFQLGKGPRGEPGAGFIVAPPPSQNGIAFCAGRFKSAGGRVIFGNPIPPPQLFPGIFLDEVNFAIQLDPVLIRGGGTISAVKLFSVSGTLLAAFGTPSAPYTLTRFDAGKELQDVAGRTFTSPSFAVGGSLAFTVPGIGVLDVAHGALLYSYPDFITARGRVDVQLGVFVFTGGLSARVNPLTRRFEADLDAHICIRKLKICGGGLAIVGSEGVVACLNLAGLHPGFGLHPNLKVEVWIIDGCKPSHFWVRDLRQTNGVAAGRAASFEVTPGETVKNLTIAGIGGAPKVVVQGPGGARLTLDGDGFERSGTLAGVRGDSFEATYIGVDHGTPGRYTITPLPGSVPLGKLMETRPGYDTSFTGTVTGSGPKLTLSYDARKEGGGQDVTFYEEGPNVFHPIGSSTGGRGTIRFAPSPGPAGPRTIVAHATVDGVPIQDQTIARFTFVGTRPAARPARVTVRRVGGTLLVTWTPSPDAIRYGILVHRAGGGDQAIQVVGGKRHSVRIPRFPATAGGTVSVSAGGALGDWSAARTGAPFKATQAPFSIIQTRPGKR